MTKWMGPTQASRRPRQFPAWPFAVVESPCFWVAAAALILWLGL